jgi:membrane protease YdiL (CAAX protease family)
MPSSPVSPARVAFVGLVTAAALLLFVQTKLRALERVSTTCRCRARIPPVILALFAEELLYRGALFGSLARRDVGAFSAPPQSPA